MHKSNITWWEKTIEYAFVRSVLPKACEAMPFDGEEEKAIGDLLISEGTTIRLIEFKAKKGAIEEEKKKFPSMLGSKENFLTLLAKNHADLLRHEGAAAHWFIYGDTERIGQEAKLKIYAHPYTSKAGALIPLKHEDDLDSLSGVTYTTLYTYLNALAEARDGDPMSSGGLIVAATTDAGIVTMSKSDFLQACAVKPKKTQKIEGHPNPTPKKFKFK